MQLPVPGVVAADLVVKTPTSFAFGDGSVFAGDGGSGWNSTTFTVRKTLLERAVRH